MSIKDNLKIVKGNIEKEVNRCSIQYPVELVAVSKFHSCEEIMQAYQEGQRSFGENHVKELLSKYTMLPVDINWHLIGHLQTNKVKSIIGKTKLIHSVDSEHLARVIDEESKKAGIVTDILLEVNISGEESKYGFSPDLLLTTLPTLNSMSNIHINGLMTVAPYVVLPEENRPIFRQLKSLSVDIQAKNYDNISMKQLSMGMTADYNVAIEEGANIIRVGTAIFGERDYSKNY